jgi:hypothetical protein
VDSGFPLCGWVNCSVLRYFTCLSSRKRMLYFSRCSRKVAQHTLSRFLTNKFEWSLFGHKRVSRLQQDPDTALQPGDVVDLDDAVIDHPYGKMLPFLCWLYDSSQKISVWGMNLVVLHADQKPKRGFKRSLLILT